MFLVYYHYLYASPQPLWVYVMARVVVASFLFMTGYSSYIHTEISAYILGILPIHTQRYPRIYREREREKERDSPERERERKSVQIMNLQVRDILSEIEEERQT